MNDSDLENAFKSYISRSNSTRYLTDVARGARGRKAGDLPPRVRLLARLAQLSYMPKKDRAEEVLKLNKQRASNEPEGHRHMYIYRSDLSTTTRAVFEADDEFVISFRGTKTLDDLGTDIAVAFGLEHLTTRVRQERKQLKTLLDNELVEAGKNIVLASHSLGGTINTNIKDYFGNEIIDEVHNFNPGASFKTMLQNTAERIRDFVSSNRSGDAMDEDDDDDFNDPEIAERMKNNSENVHTYLTMFDPISLLARGGANVHVYEPLEGSTNPHGLAQFIE